MPALTLLVVLLKSTQSTIFLSFVIFYIKSKRINIHLKIEQAAEHTWLSFLISEQHLEISALISSHSTTFELKQYKTMAFLFRETKSESFGFFVVLIYSFIKSCIVKQRKKWRKNPAGTYFSRSHSRWRHLIRQLMVTTQLNIF